MTFNWHQWDTMTKIRPRNVCGSISPPHPCLWNNFTLARYLFNTFVEPLNSCINTDFAELNQLHDQTTTIIPTKCLPTVGLQYCNFAQTIYFSCKTLKVAVLCIESMLDELLAKMFSWHWKDIIFWRLGINTSNSTLNADHLNFEIGGMHLLFPNVQARAQMMSVLKLRNAFFLES